MDAIITEEQRSQPVCWEVGTTQLHQNMRANSKIRQKTHTYQMEEKYYFNAIIVNEKLKILCIMKLE